MRQVTRALKPLQGLASRSCSSHGVCGTRRTDGCELQLKRLSLRNAVVRLHHSRATEILGSTNDSASRRTTHDAFFKKAFCAKRSRSLLCVSSNAVACGTSCSARRAAAYQAAHGVRCRFSAAPHSTTPVLRPRAATVFGLREAPHAALRGHRRRCYSRRLGGVRAGGVVWLHSLCRLDWRARSCSVACPAVWDGGSAVSDSVGRL